MLQPLELERAATGPGGLFYGVYPALVVDIQDPDNQGRVKIRLPWSPDNGSATYEVWARMATMMAGNNRGSWFIPDENDEVLIAFEGGNPRRPYVVGMLWNGQDAPPESMVSDNNLKTILSRTGVRMTMDDTQGSVKMRLETPGGHTIVMDDGQLTITVQDSSGNTIKMEASGITITAVAKLKIDTPRMEVTTGMLDVSCPFSKFTGVVKCDTLIATTVIGTTYMPGVGNLW